MKKEKGYVYILTNPSFREDWVKIGKSSRPVDIRSKELYNTAIPLPYEIYATVKTSKYDELEKNIHKMLTELADKRINPSREFFNIKPDKALEYLKDLAGLIGDAEIDAPDEDDSEEAKKSPEYKGKYIVETDEIFYLDNGICNGKMRVENGNTYILLEGSVIDPKIYSNEPHIKHLRKKYAELIKNDVVIKNIELGSPSTAGEIVRGGAVNGKRYWRTKDNKPLKDFIKYLDE